MDFKTTNLFASHAIDTNLEESGAWITPTDNHGEPFGLLRVKIRRSSSKTYKIALRKAALGKEEDLMKGSNDKEFFRFNPEEQKRLLDVRDEVTRDAVANGLIIDWAGISDKDGDVKCTPDNIRQLLQIKELEDVTNGILNASHDRENFLLGQQAEIVQDVKKKSTTSLNGTGEKSVVEAQKVEESSTPRKSKKVETGRFPKP